MTSKHFADTKNTHSSSSQLVNPCLKLLYFLFEVIILMLQSLDVNVRGTTEELLQVTIFSIVLDHNLTYRQLIKKSTQLEYQVSQALHTTQRGLFHVSCQQGASLLGYNKAHNVTLCESINDSISLEVFAEILLLLVNGLHVLST